MTARTSPLRTVAGPVPPGCPIVRAEPVWHHGPRWTSLRTLTIEVDDLGRACPFPGPHVRGWRTRSTGEHHRRAEVGRGWVDGAPSVAWECPCCGHVVWIAPSDDVTPPLFGEDA